MLVASRMSRSILLFASTQTNGMFTLALQYWIPLLRSKSSSIHNPLLSFTSSCLVVIVKSWQTGSRPQVQQFSNLMQAELCFFKTKSLIGSHSRNCLEKERLTTIWVFLLWSIVGGNWVSIHTNIWSAPLRYVINLRCLSSANSKKLFRIWLGVTEYLFRNEAMLEEVIKTAIYDDTFRSDDLEFTFAARVSFPSEVFSPTFEYQEHYVTILSSLLTQIW